MALKNYITDEDLQKLYPNLRNQLWANQANYSPQIVKAFDKLVNDVWNYGMNPSRVMIPLDLKNTGTTKNIPLQSSTETSATTGSIYEGHGERRFVVNATAITGTWTLSIQGSNSTSTPSATDSSWQTLATMSLSETGEDSVVIDTPYEYYRYLSSGGTSITFTASMVETLLDDAICHSALATIFRDFMKEVNDVWDIRRQLEEKEYVAALQGVKFAYDENLSGQIDDGEERREVMNITLVR